MHPSDALSSHFRLNAAHERALGKLGLKRVRDLLYHFPVRYEIPGKLVTVSELTAGETVELYGILGKLGTTKAYRKRIPLAEGALVDETGSVRLVWFHQAYIAKTFTNGSFVRAYGKVAKGTRGLYLANPTLERVRKEDALRKNLFSATHNEEKGGVSSVGVYPESRGVSSRWLHHALRRVLESGALLSPQNPIPEDIRGRYNLPSLRTALIWIHLPKKPEDAAAARKRFSFEEVFLIQVARQKTKFEYQSNPSWRIETRREDIESFLKGLPFSMTKAQTKALESIVEDLGRDRPMSRLLEGDVGSGKTAVAAAAAYSVITTRPGTQNFGNLETAYMVPTEILARQHFESFIKNFAHTGVNIGLITGSEARKFPSKIDPSGHTKVSRAQLLKWVANGEVPIVVGTHALLAERVQFKNLALVIIDEQHRFGVQQRALLARKHRVQNTPVPHLLSMTATPIPRTLALTVYGDLDLSVVDEMPPGRKRPITKIVSPERRGNAYKKMREEIENGRQAFVICPRIDAPDPKKELALQVTSAKEEAKRLGRDIFPDFSVGLLHGKLSAGEKEQVMKDFEAGKIQILVATSVVEVGVNIPNATIIIIEGAERFGLAQLHQLRGRVIRSDKQSYCFIFTDAGSGRSLERLKALESAKNGFELAEYDLKIRGEGSLSGTAQWGISDVGMEALKNLKMVEAGRREAETLLQRDPELTAHPLIRERIASERTDVHFE